MKESGAKDREPKTTNVDTQDEIHGIIERVRFLADCFSSGKLELTTGGRAGAYWILTDIAGQLEAAIDVRGV